MHSSRRSGGRRPSGLAAPERGRRCQGTTPLRLGLPAFIAAPPKPSSARFWCAARWLIWTRGPSTSPMRPMARRCAILCGSQASAGPSRTTSSRPRVRWARSVRAALVSWPAPTRQLGDVRPRRPCRLRRATNWGRGDERSRRGPAAVDRPRDLAPARRSRGLVQARRRRDPSMVALATTHQPRVRRVSWRKRTPQKANEETHAP